MSRTLRTSLDEVGATDAVTYAHARSDARALHAGKFNSAIYEGWLRHRRHAPRAHAFTYRIAMLLVDLSETDALFAGRWLWSKERRNVAEFRRSDFLGDPAVPLETAVRDRVENETGHRPTGPIRLLTHLRYAGHNFNPVSFYYCYRDDGRTLDTVVAEITNTPWKQRHAYVMPMSDAQHHGSAHLWRFDKRFHVSPFMPMQCGYGWRFTTPGDALRVHMEVFNDANREFDATLVLQRRPWNAGNLARVLWRYPLMTLRVVAAIHWQALRLWLKRTPIHDHPGTPDGAPPPSRQDPA